MAAVVRGWRYDLRLGQMCSVGALANKIPCFDKDCIKTESGLSGDLSNH